MANAYRGSITLKRRCLKRVRSLQIPFARSQGYLSAIVNGASLESFEIELGIPLQVAQLIDQIFLMHDRELALAWLETVMQSIAVGADLNQVWPEFAVRISADAVQYAATDAEREALSTMANVFATNPVDPHVWALHAVDVQTAKREAGSPSSSDQLSSAAAGTAVLAAYNETPHEAVEQIVEAFKFTHQKGTHMGVLEGAAMFGKLLIKLIRSQPKSAVGEEPDASRMLLSTASPVAQPWTSHANILIPQSEKDEVKAVRAAMNRIMAEDDRADQAALAAELGLTGNVEHRVLTLKADELLRERLTRERGMDPTSTFPEIDNFDRRAYSDWLRIPRNSAPLKSWTELDDIAVEFLAQKELASC